MNESSSLTGDLTPRDPMEPAMLAHQRHIQLTGRGASRLLNRHHRQPTRSSPASSRILSSTQGVELADAFEDVAHLLLFRLQVALEGIVGFNLGGDTLRDYD